jgi:cobalamin synthase
VLRATAFAAGAAALGGRRGGIAIIAALAIGWAAARLSMHRIGGLTGDGYGAICELSETAVLLVWCVDIGAG